MGATESRRAAGENGGDRGNESRRDRHRVPYTSMKLPEMNRALTLPAPAVT